MLELSRAKVAQVVLFSHERGRGDPELVAFIDGLNDDEKAALVAVMWIGRGSFEPDEFEDAFRMAQQEATTPTSEYLMGTPHFGDHLEAGMELLGIDVSEAEEELL